MHVAIIGNEKKFKRLHNKLQQNWPQNQQKKTYKNILIFDVTQKIKNLDIIIV